MKKILISTLMLSILTIGIIGCGSTNSADNKDAHNLEADGIVLDIGKTKISDIEAEGCKLNIDDNTQVKGRTFTAYDVDVNKDNEKYITTSVINKSKVMTEAKDCLVGDTAIYLDSKVNHNFKSIKIDGKEIQGKTKDEIKKLFDKESNIDEDYLYYVFDDYSYEFDFGKDGKISEVKIDIVEDNM